MQTLKVLDSSGKEGKTCLAVHLEKREDAAHLLTQSGTPIKSNQINQPTNQSAISLPTRQQTSNHAWQMPQNTWKKSAGLCKLLCNNSSARCHPWAKSFV
jgi:hypothetical protein